MKQPCVYILTNRRYGTLYVGSTTDLNVRIKVHRKGSLPGFSKAHELTRLVYYQHVRTIDEMARRERSLKRWRRDWKINLIEQDNPNWDDLFQE